MCKGQRNLQVVLHCMRDIVKHAVNVALCEGHQEIGSAAITTGSNKALYSIISIYLL